MKFDQCTLITSISSNISSLTAHKLFVLKYFHPTKHLIGSQSAKRHESVQSGSSTNGGF